MLLGEPIRKDLLETRWETPLGNVILAISEGSDYDPGVEHLSLTCEIGEQPPESLL